jgi:hypothetical protein
MDHFVEWELVEETEVTVIKPTEMSSCTARIGNDLTGNRTQIRHSRQQVTDACQDCVTVR